MAKRVSGPTTPREFLAEELRLRRTEAGLSQAKLAGLLFCAESLVSQMETGTRSMTPAMAQQVDSVFETGALFHRLAVAAQARPGHPDYFADAVEAEQTAASICHYAPTIVPGLLQTEEYAEVLTWVRDPYADHASVAATVQARLERSAVLHREDPVRLWAVMHETVLRTEVGGAAVMARQLQHVVDMVKAHKVVVQVVPFTAGAHHPMGGMLHLMSFTDAPDMAYAEGPHTGTLMDDPSTMVRVRRSYDFARAVALSPEASLVLIQSAAREYEGRCTE